MPGRSRKPRAASSSTTLVRTVAVPMVATPCRWRPWKTTKIGPRPRFDRTFNAIATAIRTLPTKSRPNRCCNVTEASPEVERDLQCTALALSRERAERVAPLVEPERVRQHVPDVDPSGVGPVQVVRDRVSAYAVDRFHSEGVRSDEGQLLDVLGATFEEGGWRDAGVVVITV